MSSNMSQLLKSAQSKFDQTKCKKSQALVKCIHYVEAEFKVQASIAGLVVMCDGRCLVKEISHQFNVHIITPRAPDGEFMATWTIRGNCDENVVDAYMALLSRKTFVMEERDRRDAARKLAMREKARHEPHYSGRFGTLSSEDSSSVRSSHDGSSNLSTVRSSHDGSNLSTATGTATGTASWADQKDAAEKAAAEEKAAE
jgi:hypothetical protein